MLRKLMAFVLAFIMVFTSLPVQAFAALDDQAGSDPAVESCTTEGCTYGKDHGGYCSNAPTYCENEECVLHYEEHTVCAYCETEGCTMKAEPHAACVTPAGNDLDDNTVEDESDDTTTDDEADDTTTADEADDTTTGDEVDNTTSGDEADDTTSGDEVDDTTTGDESDDTTTGDEVDNTTSGDEADDTTTGDEVDDTTTDDESDDSTTDDEADDSTTDDESDDSTTDDESDDSTTDDESDDSTTGDESDDTTTGDESDDTTTGDEVDDSITDDELDEQNELDDEGNAPATFNLGWEYASADLTDPTENHLGAYVTVSVDGVPLTEGALLEGVINESTQSVVTISTAEGYSISNVVLAFYNGVPFGEAPTWTDNALGLASDESTAASVSIPLVSIYDYTQEGDPSNIYLMVELAAPVQDDGTEDPIDMPTVGGDVDPYAYNSATGYPTDLNNSVYLAVYQGNDFPGEPAWYAESGYTFINGNFGTGGTYASNARSVLKPEILDVLTQGPTTDGVRVWGYYSASGTKSFFVDGSPLLDPDNEAKIIRAIKGRNVDVSDYKIIWYVIKFQTDTYWHIDGLIVEKDTYNVNYYGNGNTSGGAPNGSTGLEAGYNYTVLGNVGNLKKVRNGHEFTFIGWNTQPDGSGTSYAPGDVIIINSDVSLYAQWQPPMTTVSVEKVWEDDNDRDNIRPESISVHLLQNNSHYGEPITLNAENNWSGSWRVPAVDQSGNVIAYHVDEAQVDGYTSVVSGNAAAGFTLTNTHTPQVTTVQARKVWDDDQNRDGVRPASVTLQLKKTVDGVTSEVAGKTATVTADTSWTVQWENMPIWENGKEITYSIEEKDVDPNYNTPTYSTDEGVLVVTNHRDLAKTSIEITKVWDDNNDQDGKRPDSVTLTLYYDGTPLLDAEGKQVTLTINPNAENKATLSADPQTVTGKVIDLTAVYSSEDSDSNNWKVTISGLLQHVSGHVAKDIVYSFGEIAVDGYTMVDSSGNPITSVIASNGAATITNRHTTETIDIPVSKDWQDNDDQDGMRPDSITVTLLADGAVVKNEDGSDRTLTIKADDNWAGAFKDLPKYKNGDEITYTVSEAAITGYNIGTDGNPQPLTLEVGEDGTVSITNRRTPETIRLDVSKVWDDNNDQDGIRPSAVVITLYANGDPLQKVGADGNPVVDNTSNPVYYTLTLNTSNAWKGSFDGLPKYADGSLISYTVVETGYYTKEDPNTLVSGTPDKYTVTHGYDLTIDTTHPNPSATVTNKYTPETIGLDILKHWEDNNNQDNTQPDSVTFYLWMTTDAETAKTKPGGEGWTEVVDSSNNQRTVTMSRNKDGTWPNVDVEGLPKNQNGNPIYYSVTEEPVEGYDPEKTTYVLDTVRNIVTVTNVRTEYEKTSVSVTKSWVDGENQDGIRPTSVEVTLYANGEATEKKATITADNDGWAYTFTDLDKNYRGEPIAYTVVETPVNSYTSMVTGTAADGYTITNTHTPETVSVSVAKVWDDNQNQDGKRPVELTVTLYADDVETKSMILNAGNLGMGSFDNLPKYKNGKEIIYTVRETHYKMAESDTSSALTHDDAANTSAIPGEDGQALYTAGYSHPKDAEGKDIPNSWIITNTHEPEKISVTAKKVWDDGGDPDDKRPESVTFHLLANGKHLGTDYKATLSNDASSTGKWSVTANQDGTWTVTWSDLDKYNSGDEIDYTVQEEQILPEENDSGYTASYSRDEDGTIIVTNTRKQDTTNVTVYKVWEDDNNRDGVRPASVTVKLYGRNGVEVPDYSHEVNGVKTTYSSEITLSAQNHWYHTWQYLPLNDSEGTIPYTVMEVNAPDGYTATYPEDAHTHILTVTNTHELAKTSIEVTKVWDDNNNQDGKRPDSVTLTLYYDGTPLLDANGNAVTLTLTKTTATLSANPQTVTGIVVPLTVTPVATGNDNQWKVKINGLLQHVSGHVAKDIVYSFGENPVTGYTMVDSSGNPITSVIASNGTATITNKHTPETIDIPVSKTWDDKDDQDGMRPDSITVTLLANGEVVKNTDGTYRTLIIEDKDNWSDTFKDLPKYAGGKEITYTVRETAVDGYNIGTDGKPQSLTLGIGNNGTVTITNTRTPEVIDLNVKKVWNDYNNFDKVRPEAVVITLYANASPLQMVNGNGDPVVDSANNPVYYTLTLHSGNNWQGSWDNMPKNADGQPISYTVVETGHYDSYSTENGATNTLTEAVPEGYTVTRMYNTSESSFGRSSEEPTATVINSYTPESTSLDVLKHWEDDNNREGLRPASITVSLWMTTAESAAVKVPSVENGWTPVVDGSGNQLTATLSEAGNWDADFDELPKCDKDGTKIYYGVTETGYTVIEENEDGTQEIVSHSGVPTGYTDSYAVDHTIGVAVVTNTHAVNRNVEIAVTKKWEDNNDQDGKRPDSITVELYANGIASGATRTVTPDASGDWTAKFENLYEYYHGKKIDYTVVETGYTKGNVTHTGVTPGYTSATTGDAAKGFTITNSYTPETISIPVAKVWEDDANRDGIRPVELTVTLYADGNEIKSLILNANNLGMGSFDNLPKYRGGKEINYTVKETAYKVTANGDSEQLVVTNNVSTIPASSGFTDGYTAAITGTAADGFTITNTHKVETIDFKAIKVWDDDNDRDGKRPESITVHLLTDGVHMGEAYKRTVKADTDGKWEVTWTGLHKYVAGEQIVYTVYEEITTSQTGSGTASENDGIAAQEIEDYVPSYKRDSDTQITITNTYEPETTVITAMKVWDDDGNRDGLRPESITVSLWEDGKDTGKTQTLSEANNWSASWTDLPKYEDHGQKKIVYTVTESSVPNGYACKIIEDTAYAPGVFIITNTHSPEITGVSVTKTWADDNDNDGKRPDGIFVQLYADGSAVPDAEILLSEENSWSYTWSSTADKPLYVNQTTWNQAEAKYETKPIAYSVMETGYVIDGVTYPGLPEGYTGSTSSTGYDIAITNTRATEKVSLSVSKQWDDENNNDGIRPASVTITLYKNGTAVETVTLNDANQWKHSWTALNKYTGGVLNDYTVEENAVSGYSPVYGYTKDTSGNLSVTVINTHAIETQYFAVSKVWIDGSNAEGLRPSSIAVQIYKNGEAYGDKIYLSADNNWRSPMFLPAYENGEKIEWTIKELQIPRYYSASYNQKTMTVINTIQSKEVPKTGDYNNLWLWIALFGVCSAGAAGVALLGKKKKNPRK